MKRIDDPFIASYPSVDLHGEDRVGALIKVNELINDSLKLKCYNIVLVHGKGTGVLKENIHEYLKHDKRVEEFKLDNINNGITIVKLKMSNLD